MAERTYPEHDGTALDPKVFTHPVTAEPMPILVKDVSATSSGTTGGATSAKQDAIIALLDAQADATETQPVSLASVPLPAGAATSAKQDAIITLLDAQADKTETQPVSLASVPLPTGAATAAKQDTIIALLDAQADATETQPVSLASVPLPTGAATSAKQDAIIALLDAQADATETQPVSLASVPLPAGAATEAKQDLLLAELSAKNDGTVAEPVYTTQATQAQYPSFSRITTYGIVAAGAIHVSITNTGSATGTVLDAPLKTKETVHFTVTDRHAQLAPIEFNATGTEFVITTLTTLTTTIS